MSVRLVRPQQSYCSQVLPLTALDLQRGLQARINHGNQRRILSWRTRCPYRSSTGHSSVHCFGGFHLLGGAAVPEPRHQMLTRGLPHRDNGRSGDAGSCRTCRRALGLKVRWVAAWSPHRPSPSVCLLSGGTRAVGQTHHRPGLGVSISSKLRLPQAVRRWAAVKARQQLTTARTIRSPQGILPCSF